MDLWFSDCYLFHGTQLDPFGLVLCVFDPLYLLTFLWLALLILFASLGFLGLVVALCICIVHVCILHCLTCTSILVYIAVIF